MKILHLISSLKNGSSFSTKLSNEIVERLKTKYPDSTITLRNLAQNPLPHLEETHVHAFFTPPEERSLAMNAAIRHSDEAVAELMDADIIVIGVPMYNFGIPSTLKTWLDNVLRKGITFNHTESGPVGLAGDKKVYLAISSGGLYNESHTRALDFTEPYLQATLNFIGIKDITTYRVEGVGIPGVSETAWSKATEAILI